MLSFSLGAINRKSQNQSTTFHAPNIIDECMKGMATYKHCLQTLSTVLFNYFSGGIIFGNL